MIGSPQSRNISDADAWSHPCGCRQCQGDPWICAGLRKKDKDGRNIFIAAGKPCACGCHDEWWDQSFEAAGLEPIHTTALEDLEARCGIADLDKLNASRAELETSLVGIQQVVSEVLADMAHAAAVLRAVYEEWDSTYDGVPGQGTDITEYIDDIRTAMAALEARLDK